MLDRNTTRDGISAVSAAIETLDSEHARHLLLLSSSERYLERQAASLRQMLDSSEKMRGRAEELQTRQAELQLLIKSTYPKYEAAVGAIRSTKAEFEAALSKHFDGRRVNLMGEINQITASG